MASYLKETTTIMKTRNNYELFTIAVVKWLANTYYGKCQRFDLSRSILLKVHLVLRTRGILEAIAFCKKWRSSVIQWLATLECLSVEARSRSNPRLLPRQLRFLVYSKDIDYPIIRLILTALYISRNWSLPVKPNIDSITGPPKVEGATSEIGKYVFDFWKSLGHRGEVQIPRSVYWRKFHLTTKSGPNGHALWASVADLSILPPDLVQDIKVLGGKRLASRMDTLAKYTDFLYPFFRVTGKRYRKISAVPDSEGKTREVAILDYWSQAALYGLHRYLFHHLKKIPQDCTFDQGSFTQKLGLDSDSGVQFWSVDLTAATDRFPIDLIQLLLRARFGDVYVNSWRRVMVGHPFWTREFGEIRYSVGNPMGAYSSWNSFALCHHYVMYYCCRELGLNWGEAKYTILGDDIVIRDDSLARKYIECLKALGIEHSPQKTHTSMYLFEFAKRIFHCGKEVTPFPISALWNTRKQPSMMLNVVAAEERKDWVSPIGSPAALSELYEVMGFCRSYRNRLKKLLHVTYQYMVLFSGRMTAQEALQPLVEKYYPDLVETNNLASICFSRSIDQGFRKSFDPRKGGEPLGLIAEQLVILITGDDNAACDAFDLIQSLPVLQVHGQIEELYMKVKRAPPNAYSHIINNDWKFAMKALMIPISDRIYYTRNKDLIINASFSLAKVWLSEMDNEAIVAKRFKLPLPFGSIDNLFAQLGR